MDGQRFLIIVGTLWSLLYVSGCFIAGILLHNAIAWELALATAGVCYLSNLVQVFEYPRTSVYAVIPVIISIILGLASGITLLVA